MAMFDTILDVGLVKAWACSSKLLMDGIKQSRTQIHFSCMPWDPIRKYTSHDMN